MPDSRRLEGLPLISLSGQKALVTGAAGGIGIAIVQALKNAGAVVAGVDKQPSHTSDFSIIGDLTDSAFSDHLPQTAAQTLGGLDIVINNAGIMYTGITEAFSVEQAHTQMNTNYYGAIRATQAVLPGMRKAGNGLIINVSSIAGRIAVPYFGTYCATKFALEAYSQSLRYEVATCGVDITLVEPGPFSTGLFAAIKQPERSDVIYSYGELKNVPDTLFAGFGEMLKNGEFPDPKLVVDAYLSLAESEPGTRPMRTQVGVSWGVDELNRMSQPIQDNILEGLQIADYLGGVSQ